ncbi:potassium channel family protein [Yinghuangia aomiensis]
MVAVTADTGTEGGAGVRPSYRRIVWTAVRVIGSAAVLATLYYVRPLDRSSTAAVVPILLIGLAGFLALVVLQVRSIVRSSHPGLQAMESLSTSVPFFLLLFGAVYVAMAALSPNSFGRHLSHTDGLYFAVTVFSTVGFGDITPKNADLVVLGLAVKVILGAVRRGRQHRAAESDGTAGGNERR